jgi:hypothetical protein
MNEKTKEYLKINKITNNRIIEFTNELKLYCRLDLEMPIKEIKKLNLDQLVELVIKDHQNNPIIGS